MNAGCDPGSGRQPENPAARTAATAASSPDSSIRQADRPEDQSRISPGAPATTASGSPSLSWIRLPSGSAASSPTPDLPHGHLDHRAVDHGGQRRCVLRVQFSRLPVRLAAPRVLVVDEHLGGVRHRVDSGDPGRIPDRRACPVQLRPAPPTAVRGSRRPPCRSTVSRTTGTPPAPRPAGVPGSADARADRRCRHPSHRVGCSGPSSTNRSANAVRSVLGEAHTLHVTHLQDHSRTARETNLRTVSPELTVRRCLLSRFLTVDQWLTAFSAPTPVRARTSISAHFALSSSLLVTVPSHGEEEPERNRDQPGVVQREPVEVDRPGR